MAKYRLDIYEIHEKYHQRVYQRRFNSLWLKAAYLRALHRRYEGDEFAGTLFRVAA